MAHARGLGRLDLAVDGPVALGRRRAHWLQARFISLGCLGELRVKPGRARSGRGRRRGRGKGAGAGAPGGIWYAGAAMCVVYVEALSVDCSPHSMDCLVTYILL